MVTKMTIWQLSMLLCSDEEDVASVEERRYYSTKEKAITDYKRILSSYKNRGEYEEDENEGETVESNVKCLNDFLSTSFCCIPVLDNTYSFVQIELEEIDLDNGIVYVN